MFIEKEDLYTAVSEYQLDGITTACADIQWAIRAAVAEAGSYLNGKYDCDAIFSATGDRRHATLVEFCKSMALWYLVRRCNTDLIYSQVLDYRTAAIDWLEKVAGVSGTGIILHPDLPLK